VLSTWLKHQLQSWGYRCTLAAAKAHQVNVEVELPDRECGAGSTPSGKQISTFIKLWFCWINNIAPAGGRLRHRSVSIKSYEPFEYDLKLSLAWNMHIYTRLFIPDVLLLSFQVVVAAETGGALGGMVSQLSVDQFENVGRRVS